MQMMSKKMKILLPLTAVLAVGGCASHTGVVAMGNGTYMIAKQQATGFPGLGNMKAEIINEANAHCASIGKQMRLLEVKETQPPYILGNYPRSEIQFTCSASSNAPAGGSASDARTIPI
jgi:hypothetical protein